MCSLVCQAPCVVCYFLSYVFIFSHLCNRNRFHIFPSFVLFSNILSISLHTIPYNATIEKITGEEHTSIEDDLQEMDFSCIILSERCRPYTIVEFLDTDSYNSEKIKNCERS